MYCSEDEDYHNAYIVQGAEIEAVSAYYETMVERPQRPDEYEKGVDDDGQDSEFCGTEPEICELELLFQMGVYAHINGYQEVQHQNYKRQIEVH